MRSRCHSLSFVSSAHADDWPQWLGPERSPVWNEEGVIDEFPETGPPLRWKARLEGGYSGPAVANGRVFVMDRVMTNGGLHDGKLLHAEQPPANENFVRRLLPGRERVLCFRESDGELLWSCMCAELSTGKRIWSTFAPSTGNRPASWTNVFTVRHSDRYFLANDQGGWDDSNRRNS